MLILGGAFLAYDYYFAPDTTKIVFREAAQQKAAPQPPAPLPSPSTKPTVELVWPRRDSPSEQEQRHPPTANEWPVFPEVFAVPAVASDGAL